MFAVKDKDTQSFVYRKRGTLLQQMPLAHMYHLPAEDVVEQARRRLQKEREMWRTLQDVAVGVLLLGLLFTIAYGSTDRRSFYINKSITDTFVKARHSGRIALTEVPWTERSHAHSLALTHAHIHPHRHARTHRHTHPIYTIDDNYIYLYACTHIYII